MVFVKADDKTEGGKLPAAEMIRDMQIFNQQLADAGVIVAADGLLPSSRGARVHFGSTGEYEVEEGPFEHPQELVAGYWIWRVDSVDHAIGWLKKAPFQHAVVEIRPIYEPVDFAESMTPENVARDQALRTRLSSS